MQNSNSQRNRLARLVDFFIHPELRTDPDQFYRARLLTAAMLAMTALPLFTWIFVILTRLQLQSQIFGAAICILITLNFILLLLITKYQGHFQFCSSMTVLTLLAGIATGIGLSGGPAVSPVVSLLIVPPLCGYFFGGLRWGSYTFGIALLSLLLLYASHVLGFEFIQTLGNAEQLRIANFIVTFLNLTVISGMALIYEYTSIALKRERDAEHQKVMQLAKIDPLTGMSNRRNFDATLVERIALYGQQNPQRQFALGIIDLDGFKPINDRYGHGVGDEVLCAISDRLHAALRESDFVGRHGGDEFMLLLDLPQGVASLENMAQRLLVSMATPIETSAGVVAVSGSLGFAIFPLDATDSEELKKAADIAMYEAKQQRGHWRLYNQPQPS